MNRNLDGCYFRVKRNERYVNVCFSDLTEEEREHVASMDGGHSAEWWKGLCYHLADMLKAIGEKFNLLGAED